MEKLKIQMKFTATLIALLTVRKNLLREATLITIIETFPNTGLGILYT